VGLLTVQTDEFDDTPGANYTVMRLARDLTPAAAVGAFYFGRESAAGGEFNRLGGADFKFTRGTVEAEAFAMRSESLGGEDDWAGRSTIRLQGNAHRARLGLTHVGDAFRNDLGFVRRRGVGSLFGSYERVLRPANRRGLIREHRLRTDVDLTSDSGYSRYLTRTGTAGYELEFNDGAIARVRMNRIAERLEAPFTVAPGLRIDPGQYADTTWVASFNSNVSSVVSGDLSIEGGDFWTGQQTIAGGSVRVRLNEHVAASASLSRSMIDLPQGSFDANLARLRLDWSFTPRMFLNAFVQYNGQSDSWLTNVRFNLIHRPLSDIYVVWNEARLPGDTRRALMLKYTHLIAF
jgi:hypothetical protein